MVRNSPKEIRRKRKVLEWNLENRLRLLNLFSLQRLCKEQYIGRSGTDKELHHNIINLRDKPGLIVYILANTLQVERRKLLKFLEEHRGQDI